MTKWKSELIELINHLDNEALQVRLRDILKSIIERVDYVYGVIPE